jgi:hypothetical protein
MRSVCTKIFQLACTAALAGCVVFPTNRTYYEPNQEDGKLSRSQSCGYHTTALDVLERDVGGVRIRVSPHYGEGPTLTVYVSIPRTWPIPTIDASMVRLRDDQRVLEPKNVVTKDGGPSFYLLITYTFPAPSTDHIAFVPLPGFLNVRGAPAEVAPFRFSKKTKVDVFYGSINC